MKNKMRKAVDGGQLVVIGVAIGAIVLIGFYLFTKDIQGSTSNINSNVNSALEEGLNLLDK
ncbi:hypothetical protein ACSW8S_19230 (plasmid) [Clostridium perfringens]